MGRHRRPSIRAARGPAPRGVAYERFTRHGPAALLPLKDGRAGLVWCVDSNDDPVRELNAASASTVLNTSSTRDAAHRDVSPLKSFPLGLSAERTLTDGRTVRIGNAAQTLHPVAGQGMNLGMRDAFELVRSLAADARRRRRAAQARMAARARPLGDDRRHRLPGPQLHLGAARRRRGARPRHRRAAGARAGEVGDRAADDVRLALSTDRSPSRIGP